MAVQAPYGPMSPGLNKQINRLNQAPIIGPWLGRLGKVNRILSFPCHPTPEIWVQAAFYATAHAFMQVFSPSCLDYAMSRFKPGSGGLGSRHRPSGQNRKPKFKLDPYKIFPFNQLPVGNGVGLAALRAAELIRFFNFWLTVVDATTEGLVNWTSLAYQWQGCLQPGGRGAQGNVVIPQVILFQHAWLPVLINWTQHNNVTVGPNSIIVPRGKAVNISWSASATEPTESWPKTEYRFRLSGTAGEMQQDGIPSDMGSGTGQGMNNLYLNDNGFAAEAQLRIEYFMHGSGVGIMTGGHLTYTEAPVTSLWNPANPCPLARS